MIESIHKLTANYHAMIKHRNGIYEFIDMLTANKEQQFQSKLSSVPEESKSSENFFDQIYKIRHTMTYEETREEIFTFISGGFDTTGKVIPAVLLLLAMNPEIQEKLFAELCDVVTENDEFGEESLKTMVYLDMVIKEAGRLIPAVLIFARHVSNNIELRKFVLIF
jgi:cytochrome P450